MALTDFRMRTFQNRYLALTVASAVALAVALSGCAPAQQSSTGSTTTTSSPAVPTLPAFTPTTTTTSAAEQPVDYSRFLLTAEDISDGEDTFTQRSSTPDADGTPGASAFFVNEEDTRAITATIVAYPDPQAAGAALQQVVADPSKVVRGGTPQPFPVGTDGTLFRGTAPDGSKDVTLLVFTEGRALVRLRFESATGDATTDPFVTSIGKMQQIALRTGLADSE
jgi:hypothetical protein